MSEYLGNVYRSGEPAPEKGAYQLMDDDPDADQRTNMGRVFRFDKGQNLPGHPDTGAPAEWRFMRLWQEGAVNTRPGEAFG